MLSPFSFARRTFADYQRSARPGRIRLRNLLQGRPRPLVYETRSFEDYRVAAKAVAERNSRWLRTTWFRGGESALASLAGYCAVCGHRTWFDVDKTVCSQWQGRP